MGSLTSLSILLILTGEIIFAIGIWLYWTTIPISTWASVSVVFGLLLMLGSIVCICLDVNKHSI